ncbi:guanylate-binding protein 3-like isoform X2 [Tripterygium wilfordii]|uniref:guanylate-binding protein 3-like isoform X2 n=1 Tax=Tripterygium wilfordii TaxID=458696 RepID=UPI0018F7F939|nr:guanylate-binding protein 3-like isoform X2 [Tripterygium wilfordii]
MEKSFAGPLRLVYCEDESGEVKVNPEAVDLLKQFKGPIALLSVSGADRQGKSYVLNQLLGRNTDFQISSDRLSCSKGLWIWIVPLKTTALDDGIESNLLLLDAEGIDAYDQANFYQDLAGDGTKMTIHDYLELALKLLPGGIKDIASKNAVLDSLLSEFEASVHGPSKCLNLSSFMQQRLIFVLFFVFLFLVGVFGGRSRAVVQLGRVGRSINPMPQLLYISQLMPLECMLQHNVLCSMCCLFPIMWQTGNNPVCLQGPILQHAKKKIEEVSSENNDLILKCRSIEDKMELLTKRLESSVKLNNEYQKCYEDAINDIKKLSDPYRSRVTELENRFKSSEERCSSLLKLLDSVAQETLQWKTKYEEELTKEKATDNQFNTEIAVLKSRISLAEVRVAAANEQSQSAQKEVDEWKNKYEAAVEEAKASLQKVAIDQESSTMEAQSREDSLRTVFFNSLAEKDTEIKDKVAKLEHAEQRVATLSLELEAAESRIKNYESESSALKLQIKELVDKYEIVNTSAQTLKKQATMLEKEKNYLEQKYHSELERSAEAHERCKASGKEVRVESELIGTAPKKDFASDIEAVGVQQPAVERLAHVEKTQLRIESLERENRPLASEVDRCRVSEESAISKAALLEVKVKEREEEIKSLLKLINENGVGSLQNLKSSSGPECAAYSVANEMREAPSDQPYSVQGEVKLLQQELSTNSKNETLLDSEQRSNSDGKRLRSPKVFSDFVCMDSDEEKVEQSKRPKRAMTPRRCTIVADMNSPIMTNEDKSESQKSHSGDYTKFTVTELWQELMKHGFVSELLELKRPKKKDILDLYKKLVLQRQ